MFYSKEKVLTVSQGDESVVAEIPVFSKHKWLKTRLKSSGSNRRRLKGTILLWFIVLRKSGNVLHTS